MVRGPSIEKSVAPLRSFVAEPMRWGRLFLAGDAAHIVPPTGAKGLNLAAGDVGILADSIIAWQRHGPAPTCSTATPPALSHASGRQSVSAGGSPPSPTASRTLDPFARKMQLAELDYIRTSDSAQRSLAENYIGLPITPHTP